MKGETGHGAEGGTRKGRQGAADEPSQRQTKGLLPPSALAMCRLRSGGGDQRDPPRGIPAEITG